MPPEPTPRYPGPLPLEAAHTALHLAELSDAAFTRDGPRADVEYRDLGLAAAYFSESRTLSLEGLGVIGNRAALDQTSGAEVLWTTIFCTAAMCITVCSE